MKKENPIIKQKIYEMSNLTRAQRESVGKKCFTNLVNYFNILTGDKALSCQYVHGFASLFLKADKEFDDKEFEFYEKVLKMKMNKEELINYFFSLDKRGIVMKSLNYISHSGEKLIDDALSLGLAICFADGIMSKDEVDWFKAVSEKLALVKY